MLRDLPKDTARKWWDLDISWQLNSNLLTITAFGPNHQATPPYSTNAEFNFGSVV